MSLIHKKNVLFAVIWHVITLCTFGALYYGARLNGTVPIHILTFFVDSIVNIIVAIVLLIILKLSLNKRDKVEISLITTFFSLLVFLLFTIANQKTRFPTVPFLIRPLLYIFSVGITFVINWILLSLAYLIYQKFLIKK